MTSLPALLKKNTKRVAGLMSGTSADGIDVAIVEMKGSGVETRLRQIAFGSVPYPAGYKAFLLKNSNAETARLDDITRLNVLIAGFFANALRKVALRAQVPMGTLDLIGSHGQTIHHLPKKMKLFGQSVRGTLQIGDPSVLAKLTGVVTVGDFRTADVAVGGTGAPLVPYFDHLIFRSEKFNRGLLNIGGIANITVLPRRCTLEDVSAFDTGPGNMVIDALMQKLYHRRFDRNGEVALRGTILPALLRRMMRLNYLTQKPPKSTGRELFGETFIQATIEHARNARKEDIITTAAEFTALSIYESYLKFIKRHTSLDEVIVSGGGVHNIYLMDALRRYFGRTVVSTADSYGFSADAKEAVCFALLANETIAGHSANVPGATGATHPTILGKICLP